MPKAVSRYMRALETAANEVSVIKRSSTCVVCSQPLKAASDSASISYVMSLQLIEVRFSRGLLHSWGSPSY